MVLIDKYHELTSTASADRDQQSRTHNCAEQFVEGICFIAVSPAMHALRRYANALAKIDAPVLITGEIGTGKETVARLIHALSQRSAAPFLTITCTGIAVHALERELFGTADGFAHNDSRPGKLESCQHGTLFLSDIAEMPRASQAQLIYILEKHQFFRSGSNSPTDVDVRILAATSSPLDRTLAEQKLRTDLYYSLSAFVLHVPPLRDRRDDIPCLVEHFSQEAAKQFGLPTRHLSSRAMRACEAHPWPGNLRQLQNVIGQYAVVGDENLLLRSLDQNANTYNHHTTDEPDPKTREQRPGLKSLVRVIRDKTERELIINALEQTHWNRKLAAQLLNISYRNLLYKIEEHHLIPPAKRSIAG